MAYSTIFRKKSCTKTMQQGTLPKKCRNVVRTIITGSEGLEYNRILVDKSQATKMDVYANQFFKSECQIDGLSSHYVPPDEVIAAILDDYTVTADDGEKHKTQEEAHAIKSKDAEKSTEFEDIEESKSTRKLSRHYPVARLQLSRKIASDKRIRRGKREREEAAGGTKSSHGAAGSSGSTKKRKRAKVGSGCVICVYRKQRSGNRVTDGPNVGACQRCLKKGVAHVSQLGVQWIKDHKNDLDVQQVGDRKREKYLREKFVRNVYMQMMFGETYGMNDPLPTNRRCFKMNDQGEQCQVMGSKLGFHPGACNFGDC